jgi:CubicO group peptidase (beta-lactamase class C family)
MCVRLLEEECLISLDDSVREYIPELPLYADDITISHLLYHTSGLREFVFLLWGLEGTPAGDTVNEEELLDLIIKQKAPYNKPGEKFRYSNTGYFLLGVIVERVTGKSLTEFAQENIFDRLGMKNTHFHDDWTRVVKNRAIAYSKTKDGEYKITDMPCITLVGDDGVFTNIEDWLLWDRNFYRNNLGKRRATLIRRTLEPGHLDSGSPLPYASGLFFKIHRDYKAYFHHGDFLGFQSYNIIYPELDFSIICFSNLQQFNPQSLCSKIEDIILDEFLGECTEIDQEENLVKDNEDEIHFVKVENVRDLSYDEVKDYLGEYKSEETEATYIAKWKENRLFLENKNKHKRSSNKPLRYINSDRFEAHFWLWKKEIEFQRDGHEKVTGFIVVDEEDQIENHLFIKSKE